MTTTNQTDAQMKLADVTQADREAAHEFHREMFRRLMDNELSKTLGEEEGDARPIYQAFARHRQATEARAQGLVEALEDSKRAVQAFLDMVNVMQRVQALPIPVFLETAQHNCPIILQNLDQALATWRRT